MRHFIYILLLSLLFVACDEEGGLLIEADLSNKQVTLIAPLNNAEIEGNSFFLDWEAVADATSYEVQVATPNFDNAGQLLLNQEDSTTAAQLELPLGEYQWRVRAKNANSETVYTTASFKVIPVTNFSDNTVLLVSPEDNLITNQVNQNLSWQAIQGATGYRIQILESGTVLEELTTTDTSVDINFSEGESTWQIRAENGTENTLYSARDLLVDVTVPNKPQLTAPADEATLTSGDVSFEWTRDLIEGSTEFDSIYIYRDDQLMDLVIKDVATLPFQQSLDNDTYFWLVRAFDEAGNESNASSTFSFTIE